MQYVNDDMDELFRRAAENYPLDTSSTNWNKVWNALQNPQEEDAAAAKGRKNRGRFLWLLVLLPLGLIGYKYFLPSPAEQKLAESRQKPVSSSVSSKEQKTTTTPTRQVSPTSKQSNTNSSQKILPIGGPDFQKTLAIPSNVSIKPQNKNRHQDAFTTARIKSEINKSDENKNTAKESETNASVFPLISSEQQTRLLTLSIPLTRSGLSVQPRPLEAKPRTIVSELPFISSVKRDKRKFYLGALGGMDITSVRFQKVENAGFDYGVLFGYAINKKWSVEAGLFRDKKFYFTEGQYFNNSKIVMPPNSEITQVSGNCRMIEIPLSIKHDFTSARKGSWFYTAGISSYFMKREDYNYLYYYATSGVSAQHFRSYTNSSKNLFSVLQLSGGYTYALGHSATIRIEPYLKLPVSGVGFGQIHMASTGIHLGLTRRMF